MEDLNLMTNTHQALPSMHQIGAIVDLDFFNSKHLRNCRVDSVKFTDGKVYYDIIVPVGFDDETTIIKGVASDFVKLPMP